MRVVAGLSLGSLNPRVWKPDSPYYLPRLEAVMVSYADIHRMRTKRKKAMEVGIHEALEIPKQVKVYLDNGAFYFLSREGEIPTAEYSEFVKEAKPDWYPIPQDFIPTPQMSEAEQHNCFVRTMWVNRAYMNNEGDYIPVVHVSSHLRKYTQRVKAYKSLAAKDSIALGGIVPNLLRTSKAIPYEDILDGIQHVREEFAGKELHVFGIGGTATLHLAALFKLDSVDSSGWRNRAARGIVQLPGSGDRIVAELGKWRGREPNAAEWQKLKECGCPACQRNGLAGLKSSGALGFASRATHNLWILLEEARWIENKMVEGTYSEAYKDHLVNTTYRPLIDKIVATQRRLDNAVNV